MKENQRVQRSRFNQACPTIAQSIHIATWTSGCSSSLNNYLVVQLLTLSNGVMHPVYRTNSPPTLWSRCRHGWHLLFQFATSSSLRLHEATFHLWRHYTKLTPLESHYLSIDRLPRERSDVFYRWAFASLCDEKVVRKRTWCLSTGKIKYIVTVWRGHQWCTQVIEGEQKVL